MVERHGALPVAPRLLQPADRRSAARAGAEPRRVLVDRGARRQGLRARESGAETSRPCGTASGSPQRIVIVGGGAAGLRRGGDAAASALSGQHRDAERRRAPPVDRPNLSKDYLAGSAPEDWVPLRGDDFYTEQDIDLRLRTTVAGIDVRVRASSRSATEASSPTTGCCSRPAPSRCDCRSPAWTCRTCTRCARSPDCRAHHRARGDRTTRRRHGREFHRARGRRLVARARHRGARRRTGEAADGAHARARRWATSCAACTRSTA